MKWYVHLIIVLMIGTIVFVLIGEIKDNLDPQKEGRTCYQKFCTKTTLDMFENCIDLGYETVGFMSSEHYYLCDGNKVTDTCLEYEWYDTINVSTLQLGMRCEEDAKEVKE